MQTLREEFGSVDVLVNNAGFDRPGAFLKIDPEDFKAVWGVHLLGAINCCHACGPLMIGQGGRPDRKCFVHLCEGWIKRRVCLLFGKGRLDRPHEIAGPRVGLQRGTSKRGPAGIDRNSDHKGCHESQIQRDDDS